MILQTNAPGTGGGTPGTYDPNAIHDNIAGEILALTAKAIPVAGDMILIEDSADGFAKKKIDVSALLTGLVKTTTTIATVNWTANEATKTVPGVTASNLIFVAPAPASAVDYADAGIRATAQGDDSITFVCTETPTSAIVVNIVIGD